MFRQTRLKLGSIFRERFSLRPLIRRLKGVYLRLEIVGPVAIFRR
jgi:hypothetical protein